MININPLSFQSLSLLEHQDIVIIMMLKKELKIK